MTRRISAGLGIYMREGGGDDYVGFSGIDVGQPHVTWMRQMGDELGANGDGPWAGGDRTKTVGSWMQQRCIKVHVPILDLTRPDQ